MSFYLKKTKLKGRTYLSIDESFYNHEKKGTAHRCYESLGSVETWKAKGIEDPIAHFQAKVDALNEERADEGVRKITDVSSVQYLGYFPLKGILEKMNIRKYIDFFKLTTDYNFDLYALLSGLIYARAVNPCSKSRTFHEVLPNLYENVPYTYDQLLSGLAFFGNNYEKLVEIFTTQTKKFFSLDTSCTYFDCTNFYFEIDREDDFRRKGPSKENRKDPIVGLGLLLDNHQIPISMKLYPGNESEKPILRTVIENLKKQNNITGKTVHVADKGLNCSQNIVHSRKNGDGYLFSKSVKMLPEKELDWIYLENDWKDVTDKHGKVLYSYKSCVDRFPYKITFMGKNKTVMLTEKRLVTYNPTLAAKKRFEINRMVEKANQLTHSGAKQAEYGEAGKYVTFTDKEGEKAVVTINRDAIDKDLRLAGYNLLVTSEVKMSDRDIYDTYHNLWRIEESFKIMKSDLDARPVFCQREDTIKGHFLICYLTVLLERIFQFHILDNQFSSSEIFKFMKNFKVTKAESKYINCSVSAPLITDLTTRFHLPLLNYFLSESQLFAILNHKI